MTLYHLFVTDPRGAVLQHLAVDGRATKTFWPRSRVTTTATTSRFGTVNG
uniref:Uncharacterized protein n=1 Tax=Phenylobacterium glaciei TaxID=2803784 RepID=A0A974P1U7_9CAUL|nr:hypothetical protein JKL49_18470 [Phenylobacterium glaciei]